MKNLRTKKGSAIAMLVLALGMADQVGAGEIYGLGAQTKLIHASQFVSHSAQCPLANPLAGYWHVVAIPGATCTQAVGSQTGAIISAQLDLPEGAAMHSIDIYYTAASNEQFNLDLLRYAAQVGGSNGIYGSNVTYGSVNTPASALSFKTATMTLPNNAIFDSYDHVNNQIKIYEVQVAMPSSNWAGFLGAAIHYNRQIAPAPATATYGDVPTTHPFFNEVQQLSKSGITLGCGGGNFCPDSAVTRGQMAVFLSRALGLDWDDTTNAF